MDTKSRVPTREKLSESAAPFWCPYSVHDIAKMAYFDLAEPKTETMILFLCFSEL